MGTAYGYANQYKQDSEMNTALYVKFTVDGRTFEKTYPINPAGITKEVDHNGIKGGYLYDIKVRWTITPDWEIPQSNSIRETGFIIPSRKLYCD